MSLRAQHFSTSFKKGRVGGSQQGLLRSRILTAICRRLALPKKHNGDSNDVIHRESNCVSTDFDAEMSGAG